VAKPTSAPDKEQPEHSTGATPQSQITEDYWSSLSYAACSRQRKKQSPAITTSSASPATAPSSTRRTRRRGRGGSVGEAPGDGSISSSTGLGTVGAAMGIHRPPTPALELVGVKELRCVPSLSGGPEVAQGRNWSRVVASIRR